MRTTKLSLAIISASILFAGLSVDAQQTATATASLTGMFVTQVTVTFGGSGYGWPPLVSFTGGGGSGAGAYATISGGVLTAITVTNAGSGYTTPPQVQITAPSTTPFSSSLVMDLPLNGSTVDTGPNSFPVILNGGGTWVPDQNLKANSALSLNGVNQNLVIPYDARLFPVEMTWSAWVNFKNLNTNYAQLWVMGGSVPASGGGLQLQSGGLNYTDFNGTARNAAFNVDYSNFQANTWCQIVVTRSTDSCELFVNGQKVGSQTGLTSYAIPQPPSPWSFGANVFWGQPASYGFYCAVALNRIHTYNRALAENEVFALYTNEASGIVPTVAIAVKTIRLNISQLVPGQTYQLQASSDFVTWTNFSDSFPATNSSAFQDVDIFGTGAEFYRVVELP